MDYQLTLDWGSIQERNIDPMSPVTSDNHNKLLKIMGSHKSYICGLDVSFIRDETNNKMIAQIKPGIVVINYMVIEFKQTSTIELFQCPITERDLLIVVEYEYKNMKPAPIAHIKAIREEEYNDLIHLKIGTFHVGNWSIVPTIESWTSWVELEGNSSNDRVSDEVIPEWAKSAFVKKTGDVVNGILYQDVMMPENALATTKYVDQRIANHDFEHTDIFLKKSGDVMTGQLTVMEYPELDNHASSKKYVDDRVRAAEISSLSSYIKREGDVMQGFLQLYADPRESSPMDAATKRYVDNTISAAGPKYDARFLQLSGGILTGNLTLGGGRTELTGVTNDYFNAQSYHVIQGPSGKSVGITVNADDATDAFTVFLNQSDGSIKPAIVANRGRVGFYVNGLETAYVNANGLVGAVYNEDIVEYFNIDKSVFGNTPPDHGVCVVADEDGKVKLSDSICDPNVIGIVSHTAGFVLGGQSDYEYEFEKNNRIPIALIGQLKNVKVFSDKEYLEGSLLISGEDGMLTVFDSNIHSFVPGCILAKSLTKIHKGLNVDVHVILMRS